MESWDTYWQGLPYWDGYSYGPFAESTGWVSTGSRHVLVTKFQSGMLPVMVSSVTPLSQEILSPGNSESRYVQT